MAGHRSPLNAEQIGRLVAECQALVDAGMAVSEARRVTAERWKRSEHTVRGHTLNIKNPDFTPGPLDILNGPIRRVDSPEATEFPKQENPPKQEVRHLSLIDYVPHTEIDLDPPAYEYTRRLDVQTFIFTSWELRVKPDYQFVDCLRQIAKEYDAEMYLIPCYRPDLDFLPNDLRTTFKVLDHDIDLNDNLLFKFVETHALAASPLMGWRGFSEKSAIIPGLIKELEPLPTDTDAKILVTTGSIGPLLDDEQYYDYVRTSTDKAYVKRFENRAKTFRSQKKTTALAKEYVMPSALIVHVVNEKIFLIRRVTMQPNKDFVYDLNNKYTAGKRAAKKIQPLFLDVGDTHAWFADPTAIKATFEQIDLLQPCNIILHDFTDGISANHHEKDRAFTYAQAPPISVEIARTKELLAAFVKRGKSIYRKSNHCDFFLKILDAGEKYWRQNYNYNTCVDLQQRRSQTGKHPIELLLNFPSLGIGFSDDRQPLPMGRISVIHGHEHLNGKRAGFKELAKNYNYLSMNHLHAPREWRNAVCGGMTARKDMAYTLGGRSASIHCNKVGFDDGSMQLLFIVSGTWIV
jgi:hypothetical protein